MPKSKKNLKISLKKIRELLKAVVFNPRKPGPMAIISDQGSPEYYELRAIEEIHAARNIRKNMQTDPSGGDGYRSLTYHRHIVKAIQLLLLARLYNGSDQNA